MQNKILLEDNHKVVYKLLDCNGVVKYIGSGLATRPYNSLATKQRLHKIELTVKISDPLPNSEALLVERLLIQKYSPEFNKKRPLQTSVFEVGGMENLFAFTLPNNFGLGLRKSTYELLFGNNFFNLNALLIGEFIGKFPTLDAIHSFLVDRLSPLIQLDSSSLKVTLENSYTQVIRLTFVSDQEFSELESDFYKSLQPDLERLKLLKANARASTERLRTEPYQTRVTLSKDNPKIARLRKEKKGIQSNLAYYVGKTDDKSLQKAKCLISQMNRLSLSIDRENAKVKTLTVAIHKGASKIRDPSAKNNPHH